MVEIIAVSSQKGGVAKTTTAVNLAASLCQYNQKVLVVDLDPQGHCAKALGFDATTIKNTIFNLFMQDVPNPKDLIIKTKFDRLYLLPSNYKLGTIEMALRDAEKEPSFLDLKQELLPLVQDFDFVIIDCPPSLGYLTNNALAVATSLLLPVQCEYFAMDDLSMSLSALTTAQRTTNPNLDLLGLLITMYDKSTRLCTEIASELYNTYGDKVFAMPIPRSISLAECQAMGIPINISKPNSEGAKAYLAVARYVIDFKKNREKKASK